MSSRDPLEIRARDAVDHVERLLMLVLERDRHDRRRGRMDKRVEILLAFQKKNEERLGRMESGEQQENTPEIDGESLQPPL